jgi:hypothetical protein
VESVAFLVHHGRDSNLQACVEINVNIDVAGGNGFPLKQVHPAASGGVQVTTDGRPCLEDAPALAHTNQYNHDREYQEDVNKSTHGVRRDKTKEPQNHHDYSDCPQHVAHLLSCFE